MGFYGEVAKVAKKVLPEMAKSIKVEKKGSTRFHADPWGIKGTLWVHTTKKCQNGEKGSMRLHVIPRKLYQILTDFLHDWTSEL